jgi:putative transposase
MSLFIQFQLISMRLKNVESSSFYMEDKLSLMVPGGTYHLYNRANGNENIFLSDENYRFFKEKFKLYILPVAEVYCYCLMPNHFHFLLRIKSEIEIDSFFGIDKCKQYGHEKLISKQFSNFFSSYCQAFNKVNHRKGSLFMKNFKRKKVEDTSYLRNLVHYIHYNPVEAGLCNTLESYPYSSFNSIINSKEDFILRKELIEIFEDLLNFKSFHEARKFSEGFTKIISESLN